MNETTYPNSLKGTVRNTFSIKLKFILIFGIISLVALSVQILMSVLESQDAVTKKVEAHLLDEAECTAKLIDARVNSVFYLLGSLSRLPEIRSASVPAIEKTRRLQDEAENYPYLELVYFITAQGDIYNLDGTVNNYSDTKMFQNCFSKRKAVSEPWFDALDNDNFIISITLHVYDTDGTFVGIIGADTPGDHLSEIVGDIVIGETGYCYILGDDGTFIAHKDTERVVNQYNSIEEAKKDKRMRDLALFNTKAMESSVSSVGFYYYGGEDKIAAYSKMETTGWPVIISAPIHEFMGDVDQLRIMMIVISVIIFVATLLAIYVGTSRIVKPIKMVTKLSELASKGILNQKALSIKNNDEIGIMAQSINKLVAYLKELSSLERQIADGDLTVSMNLASSEDEIGISLNKMVRKFQHTISEISQSIDHVNEGAMQISDSSQLLSQGASQQASSLEEITASLGEMLSQVNKHAEGAEESRKITGQTRQKSTKGTEHMKELVEAMVDIEKSANDIKDIVKVIDDIAFQTNLLSLNADIEAARVGKYGRGFAVVAGSVRTLAAKSQQSAKETTAMVEEALRNVKRGVHLVGITSKQLEEIAKASIESTKIAKMAEQSSQEQARGIEQINQAIGSVEEVVQTNSASAQENAAASEELATQSHRLSKLISYFKTDAKSLSEQSSSMLAVREADS